MKKRWTKIVAACLAGSTVLGMGQITAQAASQANAGVSAMLSECLVSEEASGRSAFTETDSDKQTSNKIAAGKSASAEAAAAAKKPSGRLGPEKICGYAHLGIAKVENHLNIREGAGENFELVGKLPVDAGCEIISKEGEWFKIKSGEVVGYVKGDFLLTDEVAALRADQVKSIVATSVTQTLNARVEPNTDSSIWTMIAEGEELEVIEDQGEWIKVNVDGEECYVASEFVALSEQLPKAMTMTEIRYGEGVSNVRVDMIQYACQFVGNRYVWGGTSLTNGVDCSGFTMRIYEKYGIYLPHSSSAQSGCGTKIDPSEAKPGDLFFYGNGGGINHVAMYIGNGQVVHASSEKTGIKISNAFYRTPICVTRLLSD